MALSHTGRILENLIKPVLRDSNYTIYPQKYIGHKIGGGRHRVDIVVETPFGHTCLVSLKWQQIYQGMEQAREIVSLLYREYIIIGFNQSYQLYCIDKIKFFLIICALAEDNKNLLFSRFPLLLVRLFFIFKKILNKFQKNFLSYLNG
ncbi:MAG: hypothetical protein ACE5JB_05760 [bacterium]